MDGRADKRRTYLINYSWFRIKGSWSVHLFNEDYLSIPSAHSWGNLFHEIPGISPYFIFPLSYLHTCKDAIQFRPWATFPPHLSYTSSEPISNAARFPKPDRDPVYKCTWSRHGFMKWAIYIFTFLESLPRSFWLTYNWFHIKGT